MRTLVEQIQSQDALSRFHLIPGRIFLDTNVLQYLQDLGEYIFDNYRESEDCFLSGKKTIRKGERLFNEIVALHDFFINVNRAHFEFALSEAVYREVMDKKDSISPWFSDVWDHWRRGCMRNTKQVKQSLRKQKSVTKKPLLISHCQEFIPKDWKSCWTQSLRLRCPINRRPVCQRPKQKALYV
jgi:hypothetical protein